ncbi:MAG: class I SAM-dependent methyltransferase [Flavobacteriales bacterium]|nr:class I SAM-dependent methyltransferase [Flavobacteriales bacterium]
MDKNYWNEYYKKGIVTQLPSLFAKHVFSSYCDQNTSLVELGCGNGRDAIFFAEKNIKITAIDQSEVAISKLKENFHSYTNLQLLNGDFTILNDFDNPFDIVYSRFTMHSITEEQETDVLKWALRNLNPTGLFCIEARGLKNELYEKGEPVGERNTFFYEGHSRRFIDLSEFKAKMQELGYEIIDYAEEKGFSPFNDDDETFIRITGKKNN